MVSGMNPRPSVPAQTDKTAADDGRAAFETWARSIGIEARRMEAPDAQHYSDAMSEGMWYAWIAGRAALAAAPQPAESAVPATWRDAASRALASMDQAVRWRETGVGRPPEQTCMDSIAELQSLLAASAAVERESQIAREDRQLAATFGVMEGMKVIALILGGRGRLEELTAAMSGPLEAIERAHGIASSNESGAAC